jgi:hypothetical protein
MGGCTKGGERVKRVTHGRQHQWQCAADLAHGESMHMWRAREVLELPAEKQTRSHSLKLQHRIGVHLTRHHNLWVGGQVNKRQGARPSGRLRSGGTKKPELRRNVLPACRPTRRCLCADSVRTTGYGGMSATSCMTFTPDMRGMCTSMSMTSAGAPLFMKARAAAPAGRSFGGGGCDCSHDEQMAM